MITPRGNNCRGAGTSGDVHVELVGSQATSAQLQLDNDPANFTRKRTDTFRVACRPLGDLQKLRIALVPPAGGAAAAPWHLQRVMVSQLASEGADDGGTLLGEFEYDGWVQPGQVCRLPGCSAQ